MKQDDLIADDGDRERRLQAIYEAPTSESFL